MTKASTPVVGLQAHAMALDVLCKFALWCCCASKGQSFTEMAACPKPALGLHGQCVRTCVPPCHVEWELQLLDPVMA